MTRCKDCGRLYDPSVPTRSHLPCPTCAFYARAHGGQIYGNLSATMTLQQAYNAALCIALAKKSFFINSVDRQMIDEALDALHTAIVTAFPQASANRYDWELETSEGDEGDESDEGEEGDEAYEVGEFDIEIEVECSPR